MTKPLSTIQAEARAALTKEIHRTWQLIYRKSTGNSVNETLMDVRLGSLLEELISLAHAAGKAEGREKAVEYIITHSTAVSLTGTVGLEKYYLKVWPRIIAAARRPDMEV